MGCGATEFNAAKVAHYRSVVKILLSLDGYLYPRSIAYFRYEDLPHIPTVDRDPCLRKIIVPVGLYRSGKTRNRSDGDDSSSAASYSPQPPGSNRASITSRTRSDMPSPALPSMFPATDLSTSIAYHRGARLSEDQRVIRILNGNFFGK